MFWVFSLDLCLRPEFGRDIVEDVTNKDLETHEYVFIIGPECARKNRNRTNLKRESSVGSANERSGKEDESEDVEKNMTTKF